MPESLLENPSSSLLLVVVFFIFVTLGLLALVLRQKSRITELEVATRPKFGFLGKPLMSFGIAVLMIGGLVATYQLSQTTPQIIVDADKKVEVEIKTEILSREQGGSRVEFFVLPTLDGRLWGATGSDKFDAFWEITGPIKVQQIELGLWEQAKGGFVKTLPAGTYNVKVDVVFGGRKWPKTVSLTVN